MNLSEMSKEELKNLKKQIELQENKIKEKEIEDRKQKAKIKLDKFRENKEIILNLIEHDRTSCSDENPCNGYGSADYGARCKKCHLIEILNDDEMDGFDVSVDFIITKIT